MGEFDLENFDLVALHPEICHLNVHAVVADASKRAECVVVKPALTNFLQQISIRNRNALVEFSIELIEISEETSVLDKRVPEARHGLSSSGSFELIDFFCEVPREPEYVVMLVGVESEVSAYFLIMKSCEFFRGGRYDGCLGSLSCFGEESEGVVKELGSGKRFGQHFGNNNFKS